jgi:hypothetical protein
MNAPRRHRLVLAVYLSTQGFAFVLFEGPLAPFDWGVHGPPPRGVNKNLWCLRRIAEILRRSTPDVLVLQDMARSAIRRTPRIRRLNETIGEMGERIGIPVCAHSREDVRELFRQNGIPTKHAVAEAIARQIPALARYQPRRRKPWLTEDRRMALFDAAALALTFFHAHVNGTSAP